MLARKATAMLFTVVMTLAVVETSAKPGATPNAPDSSWFAYWIAG